MMLLLSGSVDASVGPGFTGGQFKATIGVGSLAIGGGRIPLLEAAVESHVTSAGLDASLLRLAIVPRPNGPQTTIERHLHAAREDQYVLVSTEFALDQVAFADLPALWPAGIGGSGCETGSRRM
jgi:hypothetical protein